MAFLTLKSYLYLILDYYNILCILALTFCVVYVVDFYVSGSLCLLWCTLTWMNEKFASCFLQIKYTGFRDRPHEERQARFQNACRDGRSEVVSAVYLCLLGLIKCSLVKKKKRKKKNSCLCKRLPSVKPIVVRRLFP